MAIPRGVMQGVMRGASLPALLSGGLAVQILESFEAAFIDDDYAFFYPPGWEFPDNAPADSDQENSFVTHGVSSWQLQVDGASGLFSTYKIFDCTGWSGIAFDMHLDIDDITPGQGNIGLANSDTFPVDSILVSGLSDIYEPRTFFLDLSLVEDISAVRFEMILDADDESVAGFDIMMDNIRACYVTNTIVDVLDDFDTLDEDEDTSAVVGVDTTSTVGNTASPLLTTDHETEGLRTIRLTTTETISLFSIYQPAVPPGATKIKIDVYNNGSVAAPYGTTLTDLAFTDHAHKLTSGSGTLTINVKSEGTQIMFGVYASGGGDVYFDNLRFTNDAGTLIELINSFEDYVVITSFPGWATLPYDPYFTVPSNFEVVDTGTEMEISGTSFSIQREFDLTGVSRVGFNVSDLNLSGTSSYFGVLLGDESNPTAYGGVLSMIARTGFDGWLCANIPENIDPSSVYVTFVVVDSEGFTFTLDMFASLELIQV